MTLLTAWYLQAHIKSALVGASVTIPIKDGKLVSLCTSCYNYKSG